MNRHRHKYNGFALSEALLALIAVSIAVLILFSVSLGFQKASEVQTEEKLETRWYA